MTSRTSRKMTSNRNFLDSLENALKGLLFSFSSGKNIRLQLLLSLMSVFLGILLELRTVEWAIIIGCIGLVLSLEIVNTALEELVDLVEPNYHPKAGKIKDIAAGSVLFASSCSALVGSIIFLPKLL